MLRHGKPAAHKRPQRKAESLETLSPGELHDLGQLAAEWRNLLVRSKDFVVRLRQARGLPARAVVESRLLCVLHDSLAPAVQDLSAIEREARKPDQEGA
jgi:hypothetical protein